MKRTFFSVRVGSIRSVFDMMRYDQCYPATEDDARKLGMLCPGGRATADDHVIRFASSMRTAPTIDRWASFGCEVLS
jgi:hypothetical protein